MSRVYLMADRGGAPVADWKGSRATAFNNPRWVESHALGAPRWWLVEAESADAARKVIEPQRVCEGHAPWQCDESCLDRARRAAPGRILASGGKSETDNATTYHREDGSK